jgi:glucan phosphoethanolaminetransferase (alkaline phosphatase superfamily)
MNASLPSIFAYARTAGMHTVYLDAQAVPGMYSNLMYADEYSLIDEHLDLNFTPVLKRDQVLAEKIVELSRDDQSSFILVNKVGAHFPVQDKYPDSHMRYKPVSSRGNYVNISDTGERIGFSGDVEAWRLYRNAYRNTLLWNTGEFFDQIFAAADLQNTIILYTADHGQRLHEDGSPGTNTHCSPVPRDEEGAVPLVFVTPEKLAGDLPQAAQTHHDKTSHYRLFSTMLQLMGYDKQQVQAIYGPDITTDDVDPYTFNAYVNARMGRKPDWRKINVDRIATPPVSDFAPN